GVPFIAGTYDWTPKAGHIVASGWIQPVGKIRDRLSACCCWDGCIRGQFRQAQCAFASAVTVIGVHDSARKLRRHWLGVLGSDFVAERSQFRNSAADRQIIDRPRSLCDNEW